MCEQHRTIRKHALPSAVLYEAAKARALRELLPSLLAAGHRVVLFSQWTSVLDVIEWLLADLRIEHRRFDGSTEVNERQAIIDEFTTDAAIGVLLLTTRAGGLGINLTCADTVILHDSDFNPAIDRQAMDRCHRLGQTRPVRVLQLCTQGTVDERILELANAKHRQQLAIVGGGGVAEASMGEEGAAEGGGPTHTMIGGLLRDALAACGGAGSAAALSSVAKGVLAPAANDEMAVPEAPVAVARAAAEPPVAMRAAEDAPVAFSAPNPALASAPSPFEASIAISRHQPPSAVHQAQSPVEASAGHAAAIFPPSSSPADALAAMLAAVAEHCGQSDAGEARATVEAAVRAELAHSRGEGVVKLAALLALVEGRLQPYTETSELGQPGQSRRVGQSGPSRPQRAGWLKAHKAALKELIDKVQLEDEEAEEAVNGAVKEIGKGARPATSAVAPVLQPTAVAPLTLAAVKAAVAVGVAAAMDAETMPWTSHIGHSPVGDPLFSQRGSTHDATASGALCNLGERLCEAVAEFEQQVRAASFGATLDLLSRRLDCDLRAQPGGKWLLKLVLKESFCLPPGITKRTASSMSEEVP